MSTRYYRDQAGNYLGCHIAPDAIVTDPVTREAVSVTPAASPWQGAVAIDAPPAHGLMRLADGKWTETEASLAAKSRQ